MAILPGIIFCLCIFFLLPRTRFYQATGLNAMTLYALLIIKCLIALVFAYLVIHYYPNGDYFPNNVYGTLAYQELMHDPKHFFTNYGQNNYSTLGNVFSSGASFWDDLSINILEKILAFLNIITRGNFYLNSVLFSFIGFTGSIALFRMFQVENRHKVIPIIICFFIPSTVLFTAAIHKDTIVFFAISMALFQLYSMYQFGHSTRKHILLFIYCTLLFCFRNYYLFTLLPVILSVLLFKKFGIKQSILIVYASVLVILVIGSLFSTSVDANKILSDRRQDFAELTPGTYSFVQETMSPGIMGIAAATPEAIYNVLIRPGILKSPGIDAICFMIESWLIILLMLFGIVYCFTRKTGVDQFAPLLIFSICILLIIGFTINNTMAIIRYRSLILPFLLYFPIKQSIVLYYKK